MIILASSPSRKDKVVEEGLRKPDLHIGAEVLFIVVFAYCNLNIRIGIFLFALLEIC